jgi:hypothetical protein
LQFYALYISALLLLVFGLLMYLIAVRGDQRESMPGE